MWGIVVIVEGCRFTYPAFYTPSVIATSTIANILPPYSLQYPYTVSNGSLFSTVDHSQSPFLSGTSVLITSFVPPNLYRMNYTGVFIIDAADTLLALGVLEAIHFMSSSPKLGFTYTAYLSGALKQ